MYQATELKNAWSNNRVIIIQKAEVVIWGISSKVRQHLDKTINQLALLPFIEYSLIWQQKINYFLNKDNLLRKTIFSALK